MTLVIFTMAFKSGMGRFAAELAAAAAREHVESVLLAPPLDIELAHVHRVHFRRPADSGSKLGRVIGQVIFNIRAAFAVFKLLRPGDRFLMVDLYATVPLSLLPIAAAKMKGALCILNLHDFYPHAGRYPKLFQGLERYFYRFAYRRFDAMIAMRARQVERLRQEASVSTERLATIDHGPFALDGIRRPEAAQREIRLLVLGSLRANKKILETIQAVEQLRSEGTPIELRIAGAPRSEEREYWVTCKAALERTGATDVNARFIEEAEMPLVLSNVDALICPYEGFDSQSGVAIVAASNGIPLLATDAAAGDDLPVPVWKIRKPVTSASIAAAIRQFSSVPRSVRELDSQTKLAGFIASSRWEKAIDTCLTI